jgi:hypothetical protein
MSGLIKILTLYLASLKIALRSIAILLASMLALVAIVLLSLPPQLFTANEIPGVRLALGYDSLLAEGRFGSNLSSELNSVDVIEELRLCTVAEAEALLAAGDVDAIIIMPENTLDVLVYGGHATITVKSNDPLIGSVVYSVTDNAIGSLDALQNYSLIYREQSYGHFDSAGQRDQAAQDFNVALMFEALRRMSYVETPWLASPYFVQALTMLLFLVVSVGSFFVAVIVARQYASGYIRHLYTKGVRYRHLLAAQLLLSASIALVLGLVLALILGFVSDGLSVPLLLLSTLLLSLMLTALYLCFSGFRGQTQAATTRTLIGCLALMFFLLFAGGGFYPTGMMQSSLRLFNPSWLSTQLATWTLGGGIDPVQLALFILPFAAACAIGYLEWRRSL